MQFLSMQPPSTLFSRPQRTVNISSKLLHSSQIQALESHREIRAPTMTAPLPVWGAKPCLPKMPFVGVNSIPWLHVWALLWKSFHPDKTFSRWTQENHLNSSAAESYCWEQQQLVPIYSAHQITKQPLAGSCCLDKPQYQHWDSHKQRDMVRIKQTLWNITF